MFTTKAAGRTVLQAYDITGAGRPRYAVILIVQDAFELGSNTPLGDVTLTVGDSIEYHMEDYYKFNEAAENTFTSWLTSDYDLIGVQRISNDTCKITGNSVGTATVRASSSIRVMTESGTKYFYPRFEFQVNIVPPEASPSPPEEDTVLPEEPPPEESIVPPEEGIVPPEESIVPPEEDATPPEESAVSPEEGEISPEEPPLAGEADE